MFLFVVVVVLSKLSLVIPCPHGPALNPSSVLSSGSGSKCVLEEQQWSEDSPTAITKTRKPGGALSHQKSVI